MNISVTAQANGLVFLPVIEACSQFISIRTRLKRTFVKYNYWPQQKNVANSNYWKYAVEGGSAVDKRLLSPYLPCGRESPDYNNLHRISSFVEFSPIYWIFNEFSPHRPQFFNNIAISNFWPETLLKSRLYRSHPQENQFNSSEMTVFDEKTETFILL